MAHWPVRIIDVYKRQHKAWLMTVTHHLAVDWIRLRERSFPESVGEPPAAESTEETVCRRLYVRSVLELSLIHILYTKVILSFFR